MLSLVRGQIDGQVDMPSKHALLPVVQADQGSGVHA